ncbi:MAG: hypothetical protein AB1439_07560 [candidate division FCPU426 bacterium]
MRKPIFGLLAGAVAGAIDVVPMVAQHLTWDANLSAFSLWVVSGFLIAASNLKLPPVLKGIIIPFLVLTPCAVLVGWKSPATLLPISLMTLLLGAGLGFAVGRWGK